MGYRMNPLSRGLKFDKTKLIGVFCQVRADDFHNRILNAIHQASHAAGYLVLNAYVGSDYEIKPENLMHLLDYKVCGIVRIVGAISTNEADRLSEIETNERRPIIVIDDRGYSGRFDCVVNDNAKGAYDVVNHLISLGHRRIAHLSAAASSSNGAERLAGYISALTDAGLPVDDELIVGRGFFPAEVDPLVVGLLALPSPPTALFAANDPMAAAAKESAMRRGVHVPTKLAIASFGDNDFAGYTELTSVNQHPEKMGYEAIQRLFARLKDFDLPRQTIIVPTSLEIRASSGGALL
jgi:LacI family transcriptional regulator